PDFLRCQPVWADDAGIQLVGGMPDGFGGITEAVIGDTIGWSLVGVDAQEINRLYLPPGLFQGLPAYGIQDGLVFLNMAGGLVENHLSATDFLRSEEHTSELQSR